MKFFIAIVLLALAAFALADKPADVESIETPKAEVENVARDKRGVLLSAPYVAPVAYSAYTAPVAYTGAYSLPYAYSAYASYPYYSGYYSSPYIYG